MMDTNRMITVALDVSMKALTQASASMQLFDSVEEPLKIVDPPYLSADTDSTELYTLILDLDETLVHYQEVYFPYF